MFKLKFLSFVEASKQRLLDVDPCRSSDDFLLQRDNVLWFIVSLWSVNINRSTLRACIGSRCLRNKDTRIAVGKKVTTNALRCARYLYKRWCINAVLYFYLENSVEKNSRITRIRWKIFSVVEKLFHVSRRSRAEIDPSRSRNRRNECELNTDRASALASGPDDARTIREENRICDYKFRRTRARSTLMSPCTSLPSFFSLMLVRSSTPLNLLARKS